MEDALVHPIKEVKAVRVDGVLILVVMDDALVRVSKDLSLLNVDES